MALLPMRRPVTSIGARFLPRGWSDLLRQFGLFALAFAFYDLVRGLVDNAGGYKPFGDAMRIIDLERTLHVFVEPSIQSWTTGQHWLMDAADWTYLNGHFLVTFGALAYIYLRRNSHFYFVRNMFLIAMAIALVGYWLYPTAPPRLFRELGFTDSVSQFLLGGTASTDEGPAKAFINIYAAVYFAVRKLLLKETGRKLAHVEKQLRTGQSISQELTERLKQHSL